jgi:hypothetical protein
MSVTLPIKADRPVNVLAWLGFVVFAAVLCYVLASAFSNGSEARAKAESQKAAEIEQENSAFCNKFGMGPGSSVFAACWDDLMAIRQRERERHSKEFDPW